MICRFPEKLVIRVSPRGCVINETKRPAYTPSAKREPLWAHKNSAVKIIKYTMAPKKTPEIEKS